MIRHRSRFLALVIALALVAPAVAAQADTTTRQIAKPIYRGKVRAKLIRRGRNQRFRPQARQQLATELKAMDVNSKDFQKKVSSAPLQVRMEVFSHFAQQASGTAPTNHHATSPHVTPPEKAVHQRRPSVRGAESCGDVHQACHRPRRTIGAHD